MPRQKSLRILQELPLVKGFRPLWMRPNYRTAVKMPLEEYEVIRLVDYESKTHEEAAGMMGVSRPTLTRIYESARKNLATAIVEGRSFLIEGGDVRISETHYLCESCHNKFSAGAELTASQCPSCASTRILCLSECFMQGCRRCSRCR